MIVFTIGFFVHILSLSIFVLVLEFGVIGVGISTSINFTLNFTLISWYVELQSDQNKTPSWKFGISLIQYAPEFLKYGLTSCLALFLFWWPFELTVIYGGILGLEQSAGSTILNSFAIFIANINYGIALTASSIVGYNLGANLPNKARNSALSAYIFGSIVSLLICIVVFIFRFEIMHIYTSDLELIEMMESSMIEYMPMLFGCLFNWSVYSVINGMGYS